MKLFGHGLEFVRTAGTGVYFPPHSDHPPKPVITETTALASSNIMPIALFCNLSMHIKNEHHIHVPHTLNVQKCTVFARSSDAN